MKFKTFFLTTLMVLCLWVPAFGMTASYTMSGNPWNWTLDFSFTNDLGIQYLDVYSWEVDVAGVTSTTAPTNWAVYGPAEWANYGTSIPDMIQTGETLGGFGVTLGTESVPASMPWTAYLYDWTHIGNSALQASYNGNKNPSFEGVASASTQVSEPVSMLLLGLGIVGLAGVRRFKK